MKTLVALFAGGMVAWFWFRHEQRRGVIPPQNRLINENYSGEGLGVSQYAPTPTAQTPWQVYAGQPSNPLSSYQGSQFYSPAFAPLSSAPVAV